MPNELWSCKKRFSNCLHVLLFFLREREKPTCAAGMLDYRSCCIGAARKNPRFQRGAHAVASHPTVVRQARRENPAGNRCRAHMESLRYFPCPLGISNSKYCNINSSCQPLLTLHQMKILTVHPVKQTIN